MKSLGVDLVCCWTIGHGRNVWQELKWASGLLAQLARPNQFIGSWCVAHSLEVQSGANHRLCITTQWPQVLLSLPIYRQEQLERLNEVDQRSIRQLMIARSIRSHSADAFYLAARKIGQYSSNYTMLRDCGLSSWLDSADERISNFWRGFHGSLSKSEDRPTDDNLQLCLCSLSETFLCQLFLERWPTLPTTDNRQSATDWLTGHGVASNGHQHIKDGVQSPFQLQNHLLVLLFAQLSFYVSSLSFVYIIPTITQKFFATNRDTRTRFYGNEHNVSVLCKTNG